MTTLRQKITSNLPLNGHCGHQVEFVVGDQPLDPVVDLILLAAVDLDLREPLLAHLPG